MTANLFLLNQSLLQPTFPRPPVCTCKGAAAPLPRRPAEMAENWVIIIGCSFIFFRWSKARFLSIREEWITHYYWLKINREQTLQCCFLVHIAIVYRLFRTYSEGTGYNRTRVRAHQVKIGRGVFLWFEISRVLWGSKKGKETWKFKELGDQCVFRKEGATKEKAQWE